MTLSVTLIPGDGIGPEVTAAARRCIEATGVDLEWDVQAAGAAALERAQTPLPKPTLDSIRANGVALKGPVSTPVGGYRSVNIRLRDELGLYAGIRPCRALPGARTPVPDADFVVVRMTGEDLYAGIEYEPGSPEAEQLRALIGATDGRRLPADTGISIKPLSAANSRRVAEVAFEYAKRTGRSRVTVVHKATVMRHTDGVFLEAAREVAAGHPEIELDDGLVDAVAYDLVRDPRRHEVLLTPVMYGDILSDIGAALIGGIGLAPGANLGDDCAVFEAVHGSAPRHAGKNTANPLGLILSGAMLLGHVGETEAADRLTAAVAEVVADGRAVTADLKPRRDDPTAVGTDAVADAVIAALGRVA